MPRKVIRSPEYLYRARADHPPETIATLEQIPVTDNGEPLVDLRRHCAAIRIDARYAWPRQPTLWARAGVAARLNAAQNLLNAAHPGYRLVVVDAWRSLGRQRLFFRLALVCVRLLRPLWPAALVREAANKYVAAPDAGFPPPHCTGGAVDVHLVGPNGKEAAMGPRGAAAARTDYDRISPLESRNRLILTMAMAEAGFSNYEEEWWHWSYGDSGWALRSGQDRACYGKIEP